MSVANLTVPNISQINEFITQQLSTVTVSTNQAIRLNSEWKPPSFPEDYPRIDIASAEAFRITNHPIWLQEAEYVMRCMNRRLNSIHALLDSLALIAQRRAEVDRRHSDELIQASNVIDRATIPQLVQQHKVFAPLLSDGNRREAVQVQLRSDELDRLRMNDVLFIEFKPYVRVYGDEISGKAQGQIDTVCKIHEELANLHEQRPANYPYQQGSYLWENKYRHYWNAYVAASTMGCLDHFIQGVEGVECRGWAKILNYVKQYCLIVSCIGKDIPPLRPDTDDAEWASHMAEPWKSVVEKMSAHDPMATQMSITSTATSPSAPQLPVTEFPILAGTPPVLHKSIVLRPPTNALWPTGTEWKDGVLVLTLAGEMLCFTFDGEIEPRWAVRLGNAHVRLDLCNLTLAIEEIPHEKTWWVKELSKISAPFSNQAASSFIVKITDMEDFEKWRDGIADVQSTARQKSYGNEMRGRVTYEDNEALPPGATSLQAANAVLAAEARAQEEILLQKEREANRTPDDLEQDLGSEIDAQEREYKADAASSPSNVNNPGYLPGSPLEITSALSLTGSQGQEEDDVDMDKTVDKEVFATCMQRTRSLSEETVKVERDDGDEVDVDIDNTFEKDNIDVAGFTAAQSGEETPSLEPSEAGVSGSQRGPGIANGEGTSTASGRREEELAPTPCVYSGGDPVFDHHDAALPAGYATATILEEDASLNRSKTILPIDQASTLVGFSTAYSAPLEFVDNTIGNADDAALSARPNKTIFGEEDELEDVDLSNAAFEDSADKETTWTPLAAMAPVYSNQAYSNEDLELPEQRTHFTDCEEVPTIMRTSEQTLDSGVDMSTMIPTEAEYRSSSYSSIGREEKDLPDSGMHRQPVGDDDDIPLAGAPAIRGTADFAPSGKEDGGRHIEASFPLGEELHVHSPEAGENHEEVYGAEQYQFPGSSDEEQDKCIQEGGSHNDNDFAYTPAVNYVTLDDDNDNQAVKGIKTGAALGEADQRDQHFVSIDSSAPEFDPDSIE